MTFAPPGQKSERSTKMIQHNEHFVKIPKDLANINQKFIAGLTKRQAICFGIGILLGFPAFFIFNSLIDLQAGCFALAIMAGPAVFCGFYKKNGIFLEQKMKLMFEFLKKPKVRTYQSENTFEIIERNMEYRKLQKIISRSEKKGW